MIIFGITEIPSLLMGLMLAPSVTKIDLQYVQGVSLKKGPILTASRLVQLVNILRKKVFLLIF